MNFSLLVILVVMPLVLAQFGEPGVPFGQFGRKQGVCPPYPDVGVCDVTCYVDIHCQGTEKCCRTACGGTFCISPVTPPRAEAAEKEGTCPNPPTGPWVCSSRCAEDSDCRGKKKCCKNRCGAKACVTPQEDIENEII